MQHDNLSLSDAIDAFIGANAMSPVTFGRLAMKDPHFVRDIRSGRRVWPETEAKVREFMATYASSESPPPFPTEPHRTVDRNPDRMQPTSAVASKDTSETLVGTSPRLLTPLKKVTSRTKSNASADPAPRSAARAAA